MARPGFLPRRAYPYTSELGTRWADNDQYGHVNNVIYYSYFDTIINAMLIERDLLDTQGGDSIGLVVETGCRYAEPLSFPDRIWAGLAIRRIGTSSITYQVGLGRTGAESIAAEGHFTHVYVDRETRRPMPINDGMRVGLADLILPE